MIGLDTNVIVRYLVQDDEFQSAVATQFIENTLSQDAPGYISQTTLCEIAWVLGRVYRVARSQLIRILTGLLETKQLEVEDGEIVWKALRAFGSTNCDFCDALIAENNRSKGCQHTVTFDKKAAKLQGVRLLGSSK